MTISEKRYHSLFNGLLLIIAITLIFRKPCTWIIIAFAVFNICFIKKIKLSKKALLLSCVIASPFLLEVLFFYNNSSASAGLKSAEKSLALLLLPLFILGNFKTIKFNTIIFYYSRLTTIIMLTFLVRFLIVYPEYVDKYVNGVHLWEMGYVFADSIGIHAPALNMHLAFVAILSFYFVLDAFKNKEIVLKKLTSILFLSLSVFFVLMVNTRMALVNMFTGFAIVLFFEFMKFKNSKKIVQAALIVAVVLAGVVYIFIQRDPYMKEKYSKVTFAHMDKVGKLDEVENPEVEVFNSLVTRVSIWKSAYELALQNMPFGVGAADGKNELTKYYKDTNQRFLAKYEFPAHNQFLDFAIKFGIAGVMVCFLYIFGISYLGFKTSSAIIVSFFVLFFTSNLTDDFLIRFDGIVFSGLWFSLFGAYWLQQKTIAYKDQ
jgi:O-antigen ligase